MPKFIAKVNIKCKKQIVKAGQEYPGAPTQELLDKGLIEAVLDEGEQLPPELDNQGDEGADTGAAGDESAGLAGEEPAPAESVSPALEEPAPAAEEPEHKHHNKKKKKH